MAEIRHQVPGPTEEVESAEIYIPDDSDIGSGEFIVTLKPNALPTSKVFWATIIHPPELQVLATFDANMNVLVKLGLKGPIEQKNFKIPASVAADQTHVIRINFSKWKLTDAFLDDDPI